MKPKALLIATCLWAGANVTERIDRELDEEARTPVSSSANAATTRSAFSEYVMHLIQQQSHLRECYVFLNPSLVPQVPEKGSECFESLSMIGKFPKISMHPFAPCGVEGSPSGFSRFGLILNRK